MSTIPKTNIVSGNIVQANDTKNIIDALDGTTAHDILISGTLSIGTKTKVYAIGDSLTAAGIYETMLSSLLGFQWDITNLGLGGETTLNISRRLSSTVLLAGDANYVIILAGVNDLRLGLSVSDIETRLQAMYTDAHNAGGLTVIAVTLTPWENFVDPLDPTNKSWTSGKQTDLETINTWIKNTATDIDFIVDSYPVLRDGVLNTLLSTYDSGDHLHLSTAGYNVLGTLIYNSVTWTSASENKELKVSRPISLNQDLRTNDSPRFDGLTLTKSPLKLQSAGDETVYTLFTDGAGNTIGLCGFPSASAPTQLHLWNLEGIVRISTPAGIALTANVDGSIAIPFLISMPNLSIYADNAAAASLAVGAVYRTATGQLMVRY